MYDPVSGISVLKAKAESIRLRVLKKILAIKIPNKKIIKNMPGFQWLWGASKPLNRIHVAMARNYVIFSR